MASYNQIKNNVVAPSKRTASAAQKLLAKLPNIPPVAGVAGSLLVAILQQPLKDALKNPVPYLLGAGGALAATAFLGGPVGVALLVNAGVAAVITYAVIAAVIFTLLAMITIYNSRVLLAKAVVELLHAI